MSVCRSEDAPILTNCGSSIVFKDTLTQGKFKQAPNLNLNFALIISDSLNHY